MLYHNFCMCERAAESLNNSSSAEMSLRHRHRHCRRRFTFYMCSSGTVFARRISNLAMWWLCVCVWERCVRWSALCVCMLKRKIIKVPKWLHCDFKLVPFMSHFWGYFFLSRFVAVPEIGRCNRRPGTETTEHPKNTFGVFINLIYDSLKMTSLAPTEMTGCRRNWSIFNGPHSMWFK